MRTRPAYLVIDTGGREPTIARVTQRWPTLYYGELAVRLELVLPDVGELMPVHTAMVDDARAIVAAEPVDPEPPVELERDEVAS